MWTYGRFLKKDTRVIKARLLYQQAHKSTGMGMFYLNQGPRFEAWECSCVKYLLGELCRPSGSIRLEFGLIETQCDFRIPNDLIHQKKNRA